MTNSMSHKKRKEYVNCNDLHIKVKAGENQVKLFHQAFCKPEGLTSRHTSNNIPLGRENQRRRRTAY